MTREEAIKAIKVWVSLDNGEKKVIETLIPELVESEDERIRKAIINYFTKCWGNCKDDVCGVHVEDAIAWCEKQGEQKEYTFKSLPRLLNMIEPANKAKAYCQKLIDTLVKEGYVTDAKIVSGCLKQMNGEKVAMATMDEKQGNVDKENYEIAEKEKYDFVSGQFIECRKSFNEFKEDNSYWFEYAGNDTYIGRSDNILNKKFHITPRQLYCLFTQQHFYKEDNTNDETNAPTGYGKYVDECLNEATKHFFSGGEDKYSVADLFYAGVRCGKSWFEKQAPKPKWTVEDEELCQDALDVFEALGNGLEPLEDYHKLYDWLKRIKQREQQ